MSQLRLVAVPWLLLAPVRQTLRDCPSPPRAARLWPGTHRPGRCSLRSHALGCGRGVAGTSCRCALGPGPGGGLLSLFPRERTVPTAAVVHGTRGAQAVTRATRRGPPDPSWPLPPGTGLRDESRRRARAASLSPRPGQGAGVSLGGGGGPWGPSPFCRFFQKSARLRPGGHLEGRPSGGPHPQGRLRVRHRQIHRLRLHPRPQRWAGESRARPCQGGPAPLSLRACGAGGRVSGPGWRLLLYFLPERA